MSEKLVKVASGRRKEEIVLLTRLTSQAALAIEPENLYQLQEDSLKKLFQADKLATVGELAAEAAHEIRNPHAFIRSTVLQLANGSPTIGRTRSFRNVTASTRFSDGCFH